MARSVSNPLISAENVQTLRDNVTSLNSDYYILEGQFRTSGNNANEELFVSSGINGEKIMEIHREIRALLASLRAREGTTAGSDFNYEPHTLYAEADTFRRLTNTYENLKALAINLRYRLEGPTHYTYEIDGVKYAIIGNQPNPDQTSNSGSKKRRKEDTTPKSVKVIKKSKNSTVKSATKSTASKPEDITFPNLKIGGSPRGKTCDTNQAVQDDAFQMTPSHPELPLPASSTDSIAPLYDGPLVDNFHANPFVHEHPLNKELKLAKNKIAKLEAKLEKSSKRGADEKSISAMAITFTNNLEEKNMEINKLRAKLEEQVRKVQNSENHILAVSSDADIEAKNLKNEIKRLKTAAQAFELEILELKAVVAEKDVVIQDRDTRLRKAAGAQLLRMHREKQNEDATRDLEHRRVELVACLDELASQKQNLEEQIRDLQVEKGVLEKIVVE